MYLKKREEYLKCSTGVWVDLADLGKQNLLLGFLGLCYKKF